MSPVPFIKVCGLRDRSNIEAILDLGPDYVGFIFYSKSPRFLNDSATILDLDNSIKKVGVFVNESEDIIRKKVDQYSLDVIQLHGDETPGFAHRLANTGCTIWKAIPVSSIDSFNSISPYAGAVNAILLDTASTVKGGSGVQFDWQILTSYKESLPFILSGGISIQDVDRIIQINHSSLIGVDINSKFEIQPGVKDTALVQSFIFKIKNQYS
jgi:phosphoribosylanthranilate isomerase